ncbi:MAG: hypothetical protein Q8P59_06930, partial [Dehalococcoidia bacterium]|nr:hypothetical protein [Dehalococcoidia bacterium]
MAGQRSSLGVEGYWFTYQGRPLYLMGSGMESIYAGLGGSASSPRESLERWMAYLDLLARYKVNMVRFYAWAFVWDDNEVWGDTEPWEGASPWHYTNFDPPMYDLETFSEGYWETVRAVAKAASDRDIILEYALFEGWGGNQTWTKHPWNTRTGGPLGNKQDFFDLGNPRNLYFQERYVQKVLDELAGLPNIILEITNELAPNRYARSWAAYWTAFLEERAPEHLVTISEPSWHFGPEMATEAYWEWPGIDVVSAHETRGELALYGGYAQDRFAGYWERGLDKPLMINEWCGVGESLSYADERKFFWTVLTSGGHGVRGCWQPFGETSSLPWLRNIADFLDGAVLGRPVDLSRMRPSHHLARLIDVPPGYHVLTLAGVGEEYLIY